MTIAVIIIAAVIGLAVIKTALGSLTALENLEVNRLGLAAGNQTENCANEALIQLNRDNGYNGGVFNLSGGGCTVSIVPNGGNRALTVTGTLNNYSQTITVVVTLSPFTVITWDN